ncbi:MAG: quinol monooxygenase YgiN [Maribacter sp.]|jgi:quinol monooxygenase YgiN
MSQVTTLTFFKYASFTNKVWAFGMMQFAHKPLAKEKGLLHYKLMGSGKDGFDPFADWSVYALLQVWESEEAATRFFDTSTLYQRYVRKTTQQWVIFLRSIKAKGTWAGVTPFVPSSEINSSNPYIAVITRATIKPKMLGTFWKYVPALQASLKDNKGLLFTKGIGEVPFLQMATFSLWKDKQSLMDFAYKSREHTEAIAKTRSLDWYNEELFSRFEPYRSKGTWDGVPSLPF